MTLLFDCASFGQYLRCMSKVSGIERDPHLLIHTPHTFRRTVDHRARLVDPAHAEQSFGPQSPKMTASRNCRFDRLVSCSISIRKSPNCEIAFNEFVDDIRILRV